jgi:cell division protease FtsH
VWLGSESVANQLTICRSGASLVDCPFHKRRRSDDPNRRPRAVPTAELIGGDAAHRGLITDVNAWLDGLDGGVRPALRALGELLIGVSERDSAETAERFTARCLGVADSGHLLDEERPLNSVSRLTTAVALAEWIDEHAHVCEIGPGEYAYPPKWTQTDIGGQRYRHPLCLRVHFPTGTLLDDTGCVIVIEAPETVMRSAEVSAYVTPQAQDRARTVLDRLAERANASRATRSSLAWSTSSDMR